MTLNLHEKYLLVTLAFLLIIFLGFKFLIIPAMGSLSADSKNLTQNQIQVNDANSKMAQLKSLSANINKNLAEAKDASSSLFPSLDKPSLQVYFLDIAKVSGLTVTSVNVSDPVAASSPASISKSSSSSSGSNSSGAYSEPSYQMKTYAEQYKGSSQSAKSTSSKAGEAIMSNVTIKMTGNYAAAKSFLNAIRDSKRSILVLSFDCSSESNPFTFEITMQCYAAQKLDNSDNVFNWKLPNPAGKSDLM